MLLDPVSLMVCFAATACTNRILHKALESCGFPLLDCQPMKELSERNNGVYSEMQKAGEDVAVCFVSSEYSFEATPMHGDLTKWLLDVQHGNWH